MIVTANGELVLGFDISSVLVEPWCSEGVVCFLSDQLEHLMDGVLGRAVSPPVAGVQGWVRIAVEPTRDAKRLAERRLEAILDELIRVMKDSNGFSPGPAGDLRWPCPTCDGDALECVRCGAAGVVEVDPSGKCQFKLERKWSSNYSVRRIYRFVGEVKLQDDPVNREGLTWPEWLAAATVFWRGRRDYGPHVDEGVYQKVLKKAWEAGEDPTEWAAKEPPSHREVMGMLRKAQSRRNRRIAKARREYYDSLRRPK